MPELASAPPLEGGQILTIPCQWYGLWMKIKGPHHYMVMYKVTLIN